MLYTTGIIFLILAGISTVLSLTIQTPGAAYVLLGGSVSYFWLAMTMLTSYYKLESEKFRKEWLNCASVED